MTYARRVHALVAGNRTLVVHERGAFAFFSAVRGNSNGVGRRVGSQEAQGERD